MELTWLEIFAYVHLGTLVCLVLLFGIAVRRAWRWRKAIQKVFEYDEFEG